MRIDRMWSVFDWWPVLGPDAPAIFLGMLDRLMRLAVLFAAPVIVAMFLAEIGLAIVGRSAPQMDVFFLAMPVKSGVAMFMLAIYVTVLFDYAGLEIANLSGTLSLLSHAFK